MAENILTVEARLLDFISKGIGDIERRIDKFEKSTKGSFQKLNKSSGLVDKGLRDLKNTALSFATVTALAIFAKKSTEEFTKFESRLAEVNTIAKLNAEQLARLGNRLVEVTDRLPKSADELGAGFYQVLSAGIKDTNDALIVLEQSTKLAIGGLADVGSTTKLVTGIINAYGLEISEVERVSDILFTTVENGVTTIPELAGSLGRVIPIARSAGIELEIVSGAMATLTSRGLGTDIASTSLAAAITALFAPTDEAARALKLLEISAKDVEGNFKPLVDIVNEFKGLPLDVIRKIIPEKRAAVAVLTLANNFDTLEKNIKSAGLAAGATEDAVSTQLKTLQSDIDLLNNTIDKLQRKAGSGFGSMIRDAITIKDHYKDWRAIGAIISGDQVGLRRRIKELREETSEWNKEVDEMFKNFKPKKFEGVGKIGLPEIATPDLDDLLNTEKIAALPLAIPKAYESAFRKMNEAQQSAWTELFESIDEDDKMIAENSREIDVLLINSKIEHAEKVKKIREELSKNELDSATKDSILKAELEDKDLKRFLKNEKIKKNAIRETLNVSANAIVALASIGAEKSKKSFQIFQAAQIGQAIIHAYTAINKTLSDPLLPFPSNVITSVAIGGMALANVAKIKSQKFASGVDSASGGASIVGEEGLEIVTGPQAGNLPRGSRVFNNSEASGMLGGSTFIINIPPGTPVDMEAASRIEVAVETMMEADRDGKLENLKSSFREN